MTPLSRKKINPAIPILLKYDFMLELIFIDVWISP